MASTLPMVSLIIPTHQGSDSLGKTLPALLDQTYPPERFEVLIVTDRSSEGLSKLVRSFQARLALRVLEQTGQGPGARRNAGAANSSAEILIFMDDDILASPQLIEAHVDAHRRAPGGAVIGYFPPAPREKADFFWIELRDWWESNFQAMAEAGHRFTYQDLLSGNFSIGRELFERANGFDTRFPCRDDYELGYRLIRAGRRSGCLLPESQRRSPRPHGPHPPAQAEATRRPVGLRAGPAASAVKTGSTHELPD
jgi:glycosyltransferase involved in cell wall biosynthesis